MEQASRRGHSSRPRNRGSGRGYDVEHCCDRRRNTWGLAVGWDNAYPAVLQGLLRKKGIDANVTNAGVLLDRTGWMHQLIPPLCRSDIGLVRVLTLDTSEYFVANFGGLV